MRAVIQRVTEARVTVNQAVVGQIQHGLVVLLGISRDDTLAKAEWLAEKLATLRIFSDETGKMNLSLLDVRGALLVISQFTLFGDCQKGRRPSFTAAAPAEIAEPLYRYLLKACRALGVPTEAGTFAAQMQVSLVNDGPVTLILEV
jgi:D-tyrosyl-tRNA(Tyr) deacylase